MSVYSKQLSLYLGKTPVVIPFVNAKHCPILNNYYQILLEHEQHIPNDLKIFKEIQTWQQLSEMLRSDTNLPKDRINTILKKIDDAVTHRTVAFNAAIEDNGSAKEIGGL